MARSTLARNSLSIALLIGLLGCPKNTEPQKPIVIGVVAPLTGPQAAYGVSTKSGVELAIKEINQKGGLRGRPVKTLVIDDMGQPAGARAAGERLVAKEKVDLIIGGVSSLSALSLAEIAQRAQTPMITPSATKPEVTGVGDQIFRVCFVDPFQAQVMAKFARETLKFDRVALLKDLGSDYAITLSEAFQKQFESMGGKIVAVEHFQHQDKSLRAPLDKVLAAKPQAIYLPSYHQGVVRVAKALGETRPVLLGADGWDTAELLESKAPLQGSYFTTHYAWKDPRPEVGRFTKSYQKVFNERPNASAALGYDAARLALEALRISDTKTEVVAALNRPLRYEGVTGGLRMDRSRNALKPAVIVKVEGAGTRFVTSVGPLVPSPSLSSPNNASR